MIRVPDEYGVHWDTCPDCGSKYHIAEGCSCWQQPYDEDEFDAENEPESEDFDEWPDNYPEDAFEDVLEDTFEDVEQEEP